MKNITLRSLCIAALFPLSYTAMADHISLTVAEPSAQQHAVIARARILTSGDVRDYNDFGRENVVAPADFKDAKISKQALSVKLPARSIVVVEVE